ncbi:MAG: EAL domain-containing protein [Halieaceae bacterium]|jgi:EAL domain-containing protein (putative c-di-GMP-specific phosphodiesterase class I)|nr:EAL domain-containing protein [Halieaceae bacterium]
MTLQRQLWIAIAGLLLIVFAATFAITGISTSRYLSEQLSIKNADEATALALSLSQQRLSPAELEVQLAAKLDLGTYARIALMESDGSAFFDRQRSFGDSSVPSFIARLFPIEAIPGRAEVSSGWQRLGTLLVESHTDFAYRELWALAQRMVAALIGSILLAGFIAALILQRILRPLGTVVAQAEALGERRFERQPLPRTREFAAVTRAMNALTDRVEAMLSSEGERLSARQRSDETDAVTQLLGRDGFLARLDSRLTRESETSAGSLALLRISGLMELNRDFGRELVDSVLADIGQTLKAWESDVPALCCARLNGSDLAALLPLEDYPERLGTALRRRVHDVFERHGLAEELLLPSAALHYGPGDTAKDLLTRLDRTLANDGGDSAMPVSLAATGTAIEAPGKVAARRWRERINAALMDESFQLEFFPVVDQTGNVLHEEGMLRLSVDGDLYTGSHIMPWAHRLALGADVDRCVVSMGMHRCLSDSGAYTVSVSAAGLQQEEFLPWLGNQLGNLGEAAGSLAFEVDEGAAFDHPEAFAALRDLAHRTGVGLGLKHVGHRLAQLDLIARLGPDYLKIDRMFVHHVEETLARRQMLEAFAAIALSLGIPSIAEGVTSAEERAAAFACGVSAVTGPGARS